MLGVTLGLIGGVSTPPGCTLGWTFVGGAFGASGVSPSGRHFTHSTWQSLLQASICQPTSIIVASQRLSQRLRPLSHPIRSADFSAAKAECFGRALNDTNTSMANSSAENKASNRDFDLANIT
jgi:hypothetical protein